VSPLVRAHDWRDVIGKRWLLWDTNAINDVIVYDAIEIFEELRSLDIPSCYIHPIELELLATNSPAQQFSRANLLAREFTEIPLRDDIVAKAKLIQQTISSTVQPSIADLYLGGVLANYPPGKMLLLTSNLRDFPAPYFRRESYVTFEGPRKSSSPAFISADLKQLMIK
jgi:hypothetical protein